MPANEILSKMQRIQLIHKSALAAAPGSAHTFPSLYFRVSRSARSPLAMNRVPFTTAAIIQNEFIKSRRIASSRSLASRRSLCAVCVCRVDCGSKNELKYREMRRYAVAENNQINIHIYRADKARIGEMQMLIGARN